MRCYVLLLLCQFALCIHAQKQASKWFFGDHAGLDFAGGTPVSIPGATGLTMSYAEGTSSISDSTGQLLFFSNGDTVWNRLQQPMLNGTDMDGSFSSTQSSLIVPRPGSERFFDLFTVGDYFVDQLTTGFRHSVVDMCGDGGLGEVLMNEKNILLLDTVEEKVACVGHLNGTDQWIITRKLYSDAFYAFLLTAQGITDTVVSHAGPSHTTFQGQMKVSPDGSTIALASAQHWVPPYHLELYSFDRGTGIVSDHRELTRPFDAASYGVEFSPAGTKLYATYAGFGIGTGVVQYDLQAGGGDITSINASRTSVHLATTVVMLRALQCAPDGKIYMPGLYNMLHAIELPEMPGTQCGFVQNAVTLTTGNVNIGLPTFPAASSFTNTVVDCVTEHIPETLAHPPLHISPNPSSGEILIAIEGSGGRSSIVIKDMAGRTVMVHQVNGPGQVRLSLHRLPNGVYLLEHLHGDGTRASLPSRLLLE